jgi:hypothetical protein
MRVRAWWGVALVLVACGGDEERAEGTYIDRMPGVDLWVAVTVESEQAAAFVCGGEQTLETHTRWMTTSLGATGSSLRFEKDGWVLALEIVDDTLAGDLVGPDGAALAVAARASTAPLAGLYTAIDSGCRAGVIIADVEAAQGAWCDTLDNFSQVTPLSPIERQPLGIEVTATDTPNGPHTFFVDLASPAAVAAGP